MAEYSDEREYLQQDTYALSQPSSDEIIFLLVVLVNIYIHMCMCREPMNKKYIHLMWIQGKADAFKYPKWR